MTTAVVTPKRTRRRPTRRTGGRGFWGAFRRASHTDNLRARLGGAAGRGATHLVNRYRRRRGLAPAPIVGGWFTGGTGRSRGYAPRPAPRRPRTGGLDRPLSFGETFRGRRATTARRTGGPADPSPRRRTTQPPAPAGKLGAAFEGKHVRATNTPRPLKPGTISVRTSGIAGPGNRGAGAGMGASAFGTGGAHGDDGHMLSPGSAGGSATGGAPVPDGGLYGGRPSGGERAPAIKTATRGRASDVAGMRWGRGSGSNSAGGNGAPITGTVVAGGGSSAPPPAAGGSSGGGGTGAAGSSEILSLLGDAAPETDAEYVELLRRVQTFGSLLREAVDGAQAALIENVGVDARATAPLEEAAAAGEALAEAMASAIREFLRIYEGVISTAKMGVSIPNGSGGRNTWWTGDVG